MAGVAVGWQVYALTHSTFALGMVGLAQFLPMLALNLVVGQVADRFNRKTVIGICQVAEGVTVAGLAVASYVARLHPVGIYTAVALIGAARAFESPSTQALIPTLVEEAMLPSAIAWSTSANQTALIVGPALGGVLYAFGAHVPYSVCALLFAVAAAFSTSVRARRAAARREPLTMESVFSGIRYIRSQRDILGAISLDLFAVLLGGATALLPAFAKDVLHTGPWGLGLLRLSPAVGALTCSVVLAHHPIRRRAGPIMFSAVIVFGLATITFAVSRSLILSVGTLCILGAADVVSVVIRASLVQLQTPDAMRGRVSAVNSLFIGSSNQLGEFESGITASWFGLVSATVIGGVGSILVALLWTRLFPELRRLESLTEVLVADTGDSASSDGSSL